MTGLDLARVRGLYPTLASRTAQLDGGFAALLPESVIRAITATLRSDARPGTSLERSRRALERAGRARRAAADLVAADPGDVVLGANTVSLLLRFVTLLSDDWQVGDEVVLSRLDPDVVVRPLQRVARARGGVVRWAEVDLDTGDVPVWQYEDLVSRRTRVVTLSLGNPATGAVPDVRTAADLAHAQGALVVVHAGPAVPYLPLDLAELGADLLAVSGPEFGGPTVAALIARPGLFEEMQLATDAEVQPEDFEVPPLPTELLDGFTAAIDHLAALTDDADAPTFDPAGHHSGGSLVGGATSNGAKPTLPAELGRRYRLMASTSTAGRHALALYRTLDEGLRAIDRVTVLGGPERPLPMAGFTVAGCSPREVGEFLARRDVSVWTGPDGVSEVLRAFGADEIGGAAFVGVMPHTAPNEVSALLAGVRALVRR